MEWAGIVQGSGIGALLTCIGGASKSTGPWIADTR